MFAFLVSESMTPFIENITSFPTVVFTCFLLIVVLYWLLAIIGLLSVDLLDIDAGDVDVGDLDAGGSVDADTAITKANVLAGLLLRFGLNGVPVTIILSFIALLGWLICYYAVYFIMALVPSDLVRWLVAIPILLGSFYGGVMATAVVIRPLRPLFKSTEQSKPSDLVGKVAIVKSLEVDQEFGEAIVGFGGAELLLKVRAEGDKKYKKGDAVVLMEYLEARNVYRVLSKDEFDSH